MTVNRINGSLFTGLSALNGRTLSTLSAINGQPILAAVQQARPFGPPLFEWLSPLVNFNSIQLAASALGLTSPSGTGLVSLVLFNEGAGVPFDLGAQRRCTVGGSPAWVSGIAGWCGNSPTTSDYYLIPSNGVFETVPTTNVTIAIIRRKTDTTLRTGSLFGVAHSAGNESQRCGAHVPFSDGTVYWDFGGASGSNRLTWTGYSVSTNIEKWVFTAGAKGMAIYFNGQLKNSSSTSVTRAASSASFRIGAGNGDASGADLESYLFFAMFNQQWGQGEVTQWAINPYCFLRQPFYYRSI